MRVIPLTQGKIALIDDENFERVSVHKWHAHLNHGNWYAKRNVQIGPGKRTVISMHQFIMGNIDRKLDHWDGNGLNNQKDNLRVCTNAQNCFNARPKTVPNKRSRFKGVTRRDQHRPWRAYISFQGRPATIGDYHTEEAAALAYNLAAQRHFREFARLNVL